MNIDVYDVVDPLSWQKKLPPGKIRIFL